ncbi:MAG: TIM barrel protein, partial [Planctomycetota bacterium]
MSRLDRRTLLSGAAFGLAGSASARLPKPAARPTAVSDGPGRRRIKRSCKLGMVGEGDTLRDKFALLADLGYDGVEIDSPSDLDLDDVLAAKQATGLEVPGVVDSVHWRDTLGDPDPQVRARGAAALEGALRDAQAVGASTVLLVPAVVND